MELDIPCQLETDEIQELSNHLENSSNISVERLEEVAISYLNSDAGKQEIKLISRILGLIESQDPSFFQRYLNVFLDQIKDPVFGVHFLCTFSNAIFTDFKSEIVSTEFWRLVQSSLTHDCSLTRKRGLYLAKRFTDDLQSFPVQNSPVENLFGDGLSKNKKIWEDYFLILECLEEKQVHIIQQILNRLQILQDFDASWGAIVFGRFFVHQNIIVVRWGVEQFFKYVHAKTSSNANQIDQCLLDSIVHQLLETLNLTKLYSKEEGEHSGQTLAIQLSDCLNKLLATYKEQQSLIINSLVEGISRVSWGPLPLLWITDALVKLQCSSDDLLSEKCVDLILNLVEHHIVYQEPVLRGAAQQNLLNCIISTTKLSSTNNLERVLYTFWSKKVIFVNTAIWDKVENYISEHHNVDNMIAEVKQKMSSLSKNELLPPNLLEKSVISSLMPSLIVASKNTQMTTKIISEIISTINDQKPNENRLYSSNRINKNYEESLRLKYQCLKAIKDIFAFPEKRKGKLYLKFTETPEISSVGVNTLKNIIADKAIALDIQECLSIIRYLMAAETVDSIGIADVYISLFDILPVEFIKGELIEDSANTLGSNKSSPMAKAIAIKILLHFARDNIEVLLKQPALKSYLEQMPLEDLLLPDSDNREEQKVLGKYLWQFRRNQLELIKIILTSKKSSNEAYENVYMYALESLDLGGTDCVLAAVDLVQALQIPSLEFIMKVRKVSEEFRKNESYWSVMDSLISLMITQLNSNPTECTELLNEISIEANITPGLMALAAATMEDKLDCINKDVLESQGVIELVVRMITFGPSFRKDQKLITETNRWISDQSFVYTVNMIEGSDHELCDIIRKRGINILFNILNTRNGGTESIDKIVRLVLLSYANIQNQVSKGRIRHFENSEIHKCKNRMLQCLLLVAHFVVNSKEVELEVKTELTEYFLDQLLEHNDQTSVRHLLEWCSTVLVAGTCMTYGSSAPAGNLFTWMEKAATTRPGSLPSFIMIIVNLAKTPVVFTEGKEHRDFLDRAISEITPWSMAQQYGLRVVSQIGFRKLWPIVQANYPELLAKYQVLNSCMSRSLQLSTNDKTTTKLTEDFYQSVFDPFKHTTLQDIFIYFPRLCCLPLEEISSQETLRYLTNPYLNYFNLDGTVSSSLESCSPSKLVAKDPLVQEQNTDNVQRKITPWKCMNIETDLLDTQRLSATKEREYPGLIVIASLIDRLPNLGGLCRTCEILGVGKMTIPSAAAVKERDFIGVSVTAEQWLPMEEVPENQLIQYIMALKSAGWSIVAIEQASKSVPLQSFQFPEKCAILLGKEREGVPVEVLNHVDYCVEIPQHGLIRSFNVHVTGSIVLWEYVRQRIQ